MMHIGLFTIVVREYDEAIDFYTNKLGFELVCDEPREDGKRWVVVRPQGAATGILLRGLRRGAARRRGLADEAAVSGSFSTRTISRASTRS